MHNPLVVSANPKLTLILAALIAFLAGCASVSSQPINQCLASDWFGVGLRDGQLGRPLSEREIYRTRCKDSTPAFNNELYEAGRNRGLVSYCSFKNGVDMALKRALYQGVCPENLEEKFLEGVQVGEQQLQSIEKQNL